MPATALDVKLPFTYPPFAASLCSSLSLIPLGVAGFAITLCTIAPLVVPLRMYLRCLGWPLGWVLPVALFFEPMRSTTQFGQLNVVLMTLVTVNCLSRAPRWPRGSLTGLAAAVKLTPLPFPLFFLSSIVGVLAGAGLRWEHRPRQVCGWRYRPPSSR